MKNEKFEQLKKKIETFSVVTSGLNTYTDETSFEIGKEICMGADTIKNKLVSIKYGQHGVTVKLPYISNTVYLKAGVSGAFSASGSSTVNQSTVTMYNVCSEDAIDVRKLKDYFMDLALDPSYNNIEDLGTLEDVFVGSKVEKLSKVQNEALWRSAYTSPKYANVTGTNLTQMDGLLQAAYTASASTFNLPKSAVTALNGVVIMDSIASAITSNLPELIDECNVYVSPADFQNYILSVVKTYNMNASLVDAKSLTSYHHPGSIGLNVVKVNGMNGVASGTILATRQDNIWVVLPNEEDTEFKLWYSKDNKEYRMGYDNRVGTGFAQPSFVLRLA